LSKIEDTIFAAKVIGTQISAVAKRELQGEAVPDVKDV
jgi:hypothetical protein